MAKKRNPAPSSLIALAVIGGAVAGFLYLRKRKAASSAPKFFTAARWQGDRLIDEKACWSVDQQAFVDKTFCKR